MVAGGLPGVQVLLDDGTGAYPYDLTNMGGQSYVRMVEGITGARGRADELETTAAAQITFVLDNTDGRFTPGSTIIASPSPIKADALIRVKLTANATTVNRYTANLIGAPVSWPGGGDEFSLVKATLMDPQAAAARRPLRSWVEEEYALDSPLGIWPLNEPNTAAAAADSSGAQAPILAQAGSGTAVVFGSGKGPASSAYSAAQFAAGQRLSAQVPLALAGGFTLSFFFTTTLTFTPQPLMHIWDTRDTGTSNNIAVALTSFGEITCGGITVAGSHLNDGAVHHVVLTCTAFGIGNLFVDGGISSPDFPLFGIASTSPSVHFEAGGFAFNLDAFLGVTYGTVFTGSLSDIAIFPAVASSARISAWAAAATGFAGESGTAHLTRVAGYAKMSVGTLDTSLTNVANVPIEGTSVGDVANQVALAEFGQVYFNGSGLPDFHNRNRGPLKTTPDVTVDANFLAEDTEFLYDMEGVLNFYSVTAAGTSITQIARNFTSIITNKHGQYPGSATYIVQSDAEALDRGNWITSTKGEPVVRVGSLVIDLMTMTAAQQAAWLAVEPDHWIRITGLPAQTTGGTTADFVVEGWSEVINATEWTLRLNVVSRFFFTAWILGDATYGVLGSTTKLYI